MLLINGNDIYISRGDAGSLAVSVVDDTAAPYEMQTGDALILEVREHGTGWTVFTAQSASSPIVIPAEATRRMRGNYDYRVVLRYADGTQTTVIGQTPNYVPHFHVMEG